MTRLDADIPDADILDPALDLREQLERLRARLLDLSNRNSLLNFRHPRRRSLRVVDELPDVMFERLVNGKALQLVPVPQPSEAELRRYWREKGEAVVDEEGRPLSLQPPPAATWAAQCGIDASHELPRLLPGQTPSRRHADNRLQTLLYPDELSDRLRAMRREARTAIEERGVNMLFLALGFLEWRETPQAERPLLAPLVLLPVEIVEAERRHGGQRRFAIRLLPEELRTNLSLKMRLERDFGLLLPEFEADDDGELPTPESYFALVQEQLCATMPQWRVRRMATLGFFQFQRLMLWEDLDPERWPDNALLASPLVRGVLGHGDLRGGLPQLQPEENDLEMELVDVADSSQAQAIKAALAGRNLVIQGPPGTGKSQTITNLIAAFLAQGKRVLFLSEKMAALEVVQRRLQQLGLGDFCLELHSHNTRRQSIIEDIARRLQLHEDMQRTPPRLQEDHDHKLQQLRRARDELQAHARLLAQETSLKVPVQQVLATAGSARLALQRHDGRLVELLRAVAVEEEWLQRLDARAVQMLEEQLAAFATTVAQLRREGFEAAASPWRGVSSAAVVEMDHDQLRRQAGELHQLLLAVQEALDGLQQASGVRLPRTLAQVRSMPAAVDEALALLARREALRQLWQAARRLRDDMELPLAAGWPGIVQMGQVLRLAAESSPALLRQLTPQLAEEDFSSVLQVLRNRVKEVHDARRQVADVFDLERAGRHSAQQLRDMAEVLENGGWLSFLFDSAYRQARRSFADLLRLSARSRVKAHQAPALLRQLARWLEMRARLNGDRQLADYFGPLFDGDGTDTTRLEKLHTWYRDARRQLDERHDLARALLHLAPSQWEALREAAVQLLPLLHEVQGDDGGPACLDEVTATAFEQAWPAICDGCLTAPWNGWAKASDGSDRQAVTQAVHELREALAAFETAWTAFVQRCGLDEAAFGSNGKEEAATIEALAGRLSRMHASEADELRLWLRHDRARRGIGEAPARQLVTLVEQGRLAADLLPLALRHVVYGRLAERLYRQHELLQRLDGLTLEQLRRRYVALDEEMMRLRRKVIAARLAQAQPPAGQRGARKRDWTQMALLRHEAGKKRRHLPLRRLLERAGDALQTLLPCFMMSPLSMAQYLPAGQVQFDVVIMDEASQLRPEACISALARCAQAVIVGDDKQMPPSNYFERLLGEDDDEEEDERSMAEDAQSILDLARGGFDETVLRWHYRSRHQSLIRFSNHQFYDGRLIVFPSPHEHSGRYGVCLQQVADGVYSKGENAREAQMVAEAAVEMLRAADSGSVGVVAMNKRQQDLIDQLFHELAADNVVVRERLLQLEEQGEPFFVKNLENVQGDERDTILISLTYGPPEPGGRVPQRFGPINREMGWRRLNVLFTRARERIRLFASMSAADIDAGGNRGRQVLRDYLHYAASGELPADTMPEDDGRRPHEPESPFEEAVIDALRAHGHEVVPQVGVDGFHIDIGVCDPRQEGAFLLGVECDGASYHGGFFARDRDRIRQQHLERLGWRIHRIWSRDWFADPQGEIQRLLAHIAAVMQQQEDTGRP